MTDYKLLENRIRKAVKQISGSFKEEDGTPLPEVAITCKGHVFCFLPANRTFTRIACGTKAILISGYENEANRILIYTFNGLLVEIEKKYTTQTGAD